MTLYEVIAIVFSVLSLTCSVMRLAMIDKIKSDVAYISGLVTLLAGGEEKVKEMIDNLPDPE